MKNGYEVEVEEGKQSAKKLAAGRGVGGMKTGRISRRKLKERIQSENKRKKKLKNGKDETEIIDTKKKEEKKSTTFYL